MLLAPFYATRGGDCDNNNPNIHPDRDEECNGRDDTCDGQIDENLMVMAQHIDADGDGHGTPRGETIMAKCPPPGYAPNQDDCDDNNPAVYGGATEVCNFLDEDCAGLIDEGDLCEPGTICRDGECIPGDATAGAVEKGAGSGCALDSESASPWRALVLTSMAAVGSLRRRHR